MDLSKATTCSSKQDITMLFMQVANNSSKKFLLCWYCIKQTENFQKCSATPRIEVSSSFHVIILPYRHIVVFQGRVQCSPIAGFVNQIITKHDHCTDLNCRTNVASDLTYSIFVVEFLLPFETKPLN